MAMRISTALNESKKFSQEEKNQMAKALGSTYFPNIDGVVHVVCDDFEGDLKVIKGAFVCSAMKDGDKFFHELNGQSYEYMVTHIFVEGLTQEKQDSIAVTCIYLSQLQVGIEKGERYINTIFGWKYIDWATKPKIINASRDWKQFRKQLQD